MVYSEISRKLKEARLTIRGFNPESLEIRFRNIQQPLLNRFAAARENLPKNIQDKIKDLRIRLQNSRTVLENASPQTIFDRGYSMVREMQSGTIVRDASTLANGTELEIIPANGRIHAAVTGIEK